MTEPDALLVRLLALRRYALQQLTAADVLDIGLLALAANASAVLPGLETQDSTKPEGRF
jgi:hypothetical protein